MKSWMLALLKLLFISISSISLSNVVLNRNESRIIHLYTIAHIAEQCSGNILYLFICHITATVEGLSHGWYRWDAPISLLHWSYSFVQWKENAGQIEVKFSEVHVPTGQLIRRTVRIRRIAVKVTVVCWSCELWRKGRKDEQLIFSWDNSRCWWAN